MTLTEVADFLKKRWPLFLLAIVAVVLTAVVLGLRQEKPEPKKILPEPEIKQATNLVGRPPVFDLSTIQLPEIPKELAVYQTVKKDLPEAEVFAIAQRFNFGSKPQVVTDVALGKIYNFFEDNRRLSISAEELSLFQPAKVGRLPDSTTAQVAAESFLKEKSLWQDGLFFETTQTIYLGDNFEVVSPEQAKTIRIPLSFWVSGLPLISQNPQDSYSSIYIGADSQVAGLRFRFPPNLTQLGIFKVKDAKAVTGELLRGAGRVVYLNLERGSGQAAEEEPTLIRVNLGQLKNSYLAYYDPIPHQNQVSPIFVLEGKFVNGRGQPGDLIVYLPAISQR